MKKAPHILLCAVLLLLFSVDIQAFDMDSSLYKRLRKIEKNICLDLNEDVQTAIQQRLYADRTQSELILTRSLEYLPQIEKQLTRYNLPAELKYLPIALSDLNPLQIKPNGGSGLWNMQYITARRYGLLVNEFVDERRDAVKSTSAAMLYLTDLNNMYHNWSYSVLAFMSSPSEVNAAINRAGGRNDFWSVFRNMDDPGKYGFCEFVAADFLMNYYKDYDLQRKPGQPTTAVKSFTVERPIYIAGLANRLGVSENDIRAINPLFRGDVIPAGRNFTINIPLALVPLYESLKDTLPLTVMNTSTNVEPVHNNNFYFEEKTFKKENTTSSRTVTTIEKTYHKVASGENLFKISTKYKCTVDELKSWNNLKNDVIYVGQKLEIRKENQTTIGTTEQPVTTTTVETPVKTTAPVKETTTQKKTTTSSSKTEAPTWIVYKVKSGDSVWRIANKFHITEEALRKNNKLQGNTIHPGQVLKIKKRD